jgi:hypothetical protein
MLTFKECAVIRDRGVGRPQSERGVEFEEKRARGRGALEGQASRLLYGSFSTVDGSIHSLFEKP